MWVCTSLPTILGDLSWRKSVTAEHQCGSNITTIVSFSLSFFLSFISLSHSISLFFSLPFLFHPHNQEKLKSVLDETRVQDTDALIPDSELHDDTQEPDNRWVIMPVAISLANSEFRTLFRSCRWLQIWGPFRIVCPSPFHYVHISLTSPNIVTGSSEDIKTNSWSLEKDSCGVMGRWVLLICFEVTGGFLHKELWGIICHLLFQSYHQCTLCQRRLKGSFEAPFQSI